MVAAWAFLPMGEECVERTAQDGRVIAAGNGAHTLANHIQTPLAFVQESGLTTLRDWVRLFLRVLRLVVAE